MSRSKNNSRKRARQKRLRAALLHLPFTSHLLTLGWWNWQTRTFEGRMPKGLRVRVPPRARFRLHHEPLKFKVFCVSPLSAARALQLDLFASFLFRYSSVRYGIALS